MIIMVLVHCDDIASGLIDLAHRQPTISIVWKLVASTIHNAADHFGCICVYLQLQVCCNFTTHIQLPVELLSGQYTLCEPNRTRVLTNLAK